MSQQEIQQLLEQPYNRQTWKNFLQTQFSNIQLNLQDREIALSNNNLSDKCLHLGFYKLNEYSKIGIFEVHLKDNVNITRNRVALRNLLRSIFQQMSALMVVFVQDKKWRFSYVSKGQTINQETGDIEDIQTAPKRYTYLFGQGEKALTAAQRFDKLIQRESLYNFLELKDFEDAFSVEKLSKEFFDNYKVIYEEFVEFLTGRRYVKKGNKYTELLVADSNWQLTRFFDKDQKQARDFIKRMMGRIVFLYFIQKKGWLAVEKDKIWGQGNQNYLYELFQNTKYKDDFYSRELVPLFFNRLNNKNSENQTQQERFPYLNGGLFDDKQDKKHNDLRLPEDIFKKMFNFFEQYNFTIYEDSPDEQTVAVDPEMLGHIFENLLEDNKDKGAFYTPKEIVHYMCKESLKAYLLENQTFNNIDLAKSTIDKIIDQQQELTTQETNFIKENAYQIIDTLEKVKILDPAIGSGAFPMGILQEIFNLQIYLHGLKGYKKDVTDAEIKKNIIEKSIYGVDIESGAVDIARLRFWLSLVVDEQTPQPLPNLDFKIICANTLIPLRRSNELDFDSRASIAAKKLEEIRDDFYSVSNIEKAKLTKKFYQIQSELLHLRELATKDNYEFYTQLYSFDPFKEKPCQWFDPQWMFGIKDGFDIVIGNPPYVNIENLDQNTKKHIFDNYKTCKGRTDIYIAFIERALQISKNKGVFTFIIPYPYTNQNYGTLSRQMLIENYFVKEILDTSEYNVFDTANVKNIILNVVKEKSKNNTLIKIAKSKQNFNDNSFDSFYINQNNFIELKDFRFETKNITSELKLKPIIWENAIRLDEICLIAYGARLNHKTKKINKENYIYDEFSESFKPFLEGKNIERFNYSQQGWLNYQPKEHYNAMFTELFENEKIFFIRLVKDKLRFAFDKKHFYNSHTVINCVKWNLLEDVNHITVKKNISINISKKYDYLFLLGILNSNLINWYFNNFLSDSLNFYPDDAKELPIVKVDDISKQKTFTTIVDYILFQNKQELDSSFFERIIDAMVYELYFSEKIKVSGAEIIKHLGNLPKIKQEQEQENVKVIEETQKKLSDPEHQIHKALQKLYDIEEIKIIEGQKK